MVLEWENNLKNQYLATKYRLNLFSRVMIRDDELALKYQAGKYIGNMEPGIHSIFRFLEPIEIVFVKQGLLREKWKFSLPLSEGISVKISGNIIFSVVDPHILIKNIGYERSLFDNTTNYRVEFLSAKHVLEWFLDYIQNAIRNGIRRISFGDMFMDPNNLSLEIQNNVMELFAKMGIDFQFFSLGDMLLPEEITEAIGMKVVKEINFETLRKEIQLRKESLQIFPDTGIDPVKMRMADAFETWAQKPSEKSQGLTDLFTTIFFLSQFMKNTMSSL